MSIAKEMDAAIEKHFELPLEIASLANQATYALYNGPIQDDDEWPSFVTACEKVSEWCDANLSEVWYDIQTGEMHEHAPEADCFWEDYYHCDLDTVKRALFHKELVRYI